MFLVRRLIDGLQLAFVAHAGYYYAVTNYAFPPALMSITWYASNHAYIIKL